MSEHNNPEQLAKEFEESAATTRAIAIKVANVIDKCSMRHSIPALCFVLSTMGEDIINTGEMTRDDFLDHIDATISSALDFHKEKRQ